MSSLFLQLAASERREALNVAAAASGRPLHLLDKDVWLVWALDVLFRAPFADHLAFKGGSSLSKAYGIIKRFSEDVDLTYDIRALAPDLVGPSAEPLPPNRSQEKRWTKEIRTRLPLWISDHVVPAVKSALAEQRLSAEISVDSEKAFISSANFTEAAHERNIEVGVLLLSPSSAMRLVGFFEHLISSGHLVPIVG